MNKDEVSEIKKQIKKNGCVIEDVWGCYVDSEKNKVFVAREPLGLLTEEKSDAYFSRLKKTLSGSIGRNLINLEFPIEEEQEGGRQHSLYTLYQSKLEDEAMVNAFFDKMIDSLEIDDHYFIMLTYGIYDVPGMNHNGEAMEDTSENVYDFILCGVCPVTQTKPFLSYDVASNGMENKFPEWQVGNPSTGFLFPEFNDRTGDIHSVLYLTSKPEHLSDFFIDEMFGSAKPLPSNKQKDVFAEVITSAAVGQMPIFEDVAAIHEHISDLVLENETPETIMLDKGMVTEILKATGTDELHMEAALQVYDDQIGAGDKVVAENIIDVKKIELKSPGVLVRVDAAHAPNLETTIIEGRRAIVVYVDDTVTMNGIPVRILGPAEE